MSTVKATYSGFVGHAGVPVEVREGEDWDAGHPLVQARPDLFTEVPEEPAPKRLALRTAARGKKDEGGDG